MIELIVSLKKMKLPIKMQQARQHTVEYVCVRRDYHKEVPKKKRYFSAAFLGLFQVAFVILFWRFVGYNYTQNSSTETTYSSM